MLLSTDRQQAHVLGLQAQRRKQRSLEKGVNAEHKQQGGPDAETFERDGIGDGGQLLAIK